MSGEKERKYLSPAREPFPVGRNSLILMMAAHVGVGSMSDTWRAVAGHCLQPAVRRMAWERSLKARVGARTPQEERWWYCCPFPVPPEGERPYVFSLTVERTAPLGSSHAPGFRATEESEKDGLTLNIQKTKTMASGPITSWQIDGEKVDIVADFIFLGSKIIADGDCSHEIKRCLILRRKAMTKLNSVLKSRVTILPTKVHPVKAMVFPVVVYRCESWTIKKAEHLRIGAFELWCWRSLLRVLWTARRSN